MSMMNSLRSKLLLIVMLLVMGCGISLSILATYWFSRNLHALAQTEGNRLAHQLALASAERVLINDVVALQKMIDYNMSLNSSLSYLFIVKEGQVQAHSFENGFPVDLIAANSPQNNEHGKIIKIKTHQGDSYYDIAWPIFEGKGGVLRLGFSEAAYRHNVRLLWLQTTALTFGILLIGYLMAHLLIKRVLQPLKTLADAAARIDEGALDSQISVNSHDEVEKLATAFNAMVKRIKDYTQRLESKSAEINRAYQQTRKSFDMLQQIGNQPTLVAVCRYMMQCFKDVVACHNMAMVIFFESQQDLLVVTDEITEYFSGAIYDTALALAGGIDDTTLVQNTFFQVEILPAAFRSSKRLVLTPINHESQLIGVFVIACTGTCACDKKGLDVIQLVFQQTSGGIKRTTLQESELRRLQAQLEETSQFSGIVGKNAEMKTIYRLIDDTAPTEATVLIQGESGTGKELVARAVHMRSPREQGPFVVINCSAYPSTLLESELFGHEKGAFTGAVRKKTGRFEQAHGGTVFLDEIGEISLSAQVKLLRVLQTHRFERIGGEQAISVDVRIIAASNKNLIDEVKKGNFREDLYYRLNVIPIKLPALRCRKNDVPLLARHFLKRFTKLQDKQLRDFSPEAMRLLLEYEWPGNVRELENTIEHCVTLAKTSLVHMSDLPIEIRRDQDKLSGAIPAKNPITIMAANEKKLFEDVLKENGWNKKLAAKKLGISRSTLYNKIKKYRISSIQESEPRKLK